jgi:hypothetical protein
LWERLKTNYLERYCGQILGVNEDVADRNQDGLTGYRKTHGNWVVEIGGRMPRLEVAGDICCGGQGQPKDVQPMLKIIIIIIILFNVDLKRRICPSTRCPSAANTISRDGGIFNGVSYLINDLLDVDIFTKQIRTLNTYIPPGFPTSAVQWPGRSRCKTNWPACSFRSAQVATLLEFHVPLTNCFVRRWFCVVRGPKRPLHRHN